MSLTQINKAGLDEIALDHVFTIGSSGSSAYTFQGEGLNGTVNNPTLYLTRGKTYRFENGSGAHPFRIQSTTGTSGTAYNTGVTNNNTVGTVIMEVQHDAPDVLYYQCTSHAAMNGILYITGALPDGGVTTAKIAADAVTQAKIATNAVTGTQLANNSVNSGKIQSGAVITGKIAADAVTTAKIADQAVTLAKLPHGTSSNDGKFLRANNGADPTFETVTGTTINNNANNRIITGSGTANTLEGETDLTFDGSLLKLKVDSGEFRIESANGVDQLSVDSDNGNTFINGNVIASRLDIGSSGGFDSNGDDLTITTGGHGGISIKTGTTNDGVLRFGDGSGANEYRGYINYRHAGDKFLIGTSGTQRLSVDSDGLKFGSDTAAGNALDDYEIGSWTPSCSSGTFTIYNQAWYIKIGKLVTCYFYVYNFSDTSSTTHFVIGGLPFAYNNSPKHESFHNICVGGNAANMNSSCIGITGRIGQAGTTEMQLRQERYNSASVNFEHRHLGSCHLHTTFCYEAA